MRILYIAHRIPYPPNKGDKIRSFHQIRHLAKKHDVHLACLVDDREDLPHLKCLEDYCVSIDSTFRRDSFSKILAGRAVLTGTPLSVAAFSCKELARKVSIRLESKKFDLIYVYSSPMARYVWERSCYPRVMDFVDMDSEKWREAAQHYSFPRSWIYRTEADRLAKYEKEIASKFDCSILVSEAEAGLFRRRLGVEKVRVIQNGVDLDYFTPRGKNAARTSKPTLVFTGVMDYFPNVDAVHYFCSAILDRIRHAVPEVRFYVVGRNPVRKIVELGRNSSVVVTGAVPDVRPYLEKASVAVAPLRIARGIQNKVLEAMAMGLPVVGTSAAFEGIEATSSDGVRINDDPGAFAGDVATLLRDAELQKHCAARAREYVRRCHRWPVQLERLESLLEATRRTFSERRPAKP